MILVFENIFSAMKTQSGKAIVKKLKINVIDKYQPIIFLLDNIHTI